MRVHFHGATRTTTGSMFLLEVNGRKALLECGLFQGRREDTIERNRNFPFDPAELDAVILSHAHIDHCGNLPNLVKRGFTGSIFCTFATRDLASIMLEDSAEIQRADAEYVSKQRARKGLGPVEPLYSQTEAEQAVRQFVTLNYDRPIRVADGITVTFKDAGHILGSAQVVLDVEERGRKFRYLFSGDVGRGGDEILRDPAPVENVDFLQVESTYGGREHTARTDALDKLRDIVKAALERKAKIIVPAFSIGRTQQIVWMLHQMTDAGELPVCPIFVDSPLSVNATEVYRLHPECFNDRIYKFLREKTNPFGMESLTYIRHVEHSKKLADLEGAAIIISASGMAEAGRVRHHLKNHIGNPNNVILFIGYCAEHTLGAQILAGKPTVNIFGEPTAVRARVEAIDAFSGHADRSELLDYVNRITGPVRKISVVHGEESQSLAFVEALKELKPLAEVRAPERGDVIEF